MNTLINFEIAKLLKEKGFDIEKQNFYNSHGQLNTDIEDFFIPRYEAPTIAEVVMWLYEKHGIWITVTSVSQESWQCHMTKKGDSLGKCYLEDFYTPTEAYEAGVEYVLKNLI
jgi:hypothetical protein